MRAAGAPTRTHFLREKVGPMNEDRYDVIVLGSGSAARAAREQSARLRRTCCARRARAVGWLVPQTSRAGRRRRTSSRQSSSMIYGRTPRSGASTRPSRPSTSRRTRRWKDSIRRDQASWMQVLAAAYDIVQGEATVVDTNTVRVGDRELVGEKVLIATGAARPSLRFRASRPSTGSTTSARSSSNALRIRCWSSGPAPSGWSSHRSSSASARA